MPAARRATHHVSGTPGGTTGAASSSSRRSPAPMTRTAPRAEGRRRWRSSRPIADELSAGGGDRPARHGGAAPRGLPHPGLAAPARGRGEPVHPLALGEVDDELWPAFGARRCRGRVDRGSRRATPRIRSRRRRRCARASEPRPILVLTLGAGGLSARRPGRRSSRGQRAAARRRWRAGRGGGGHVRRRARHRTWRVATTPAAAAAARDRARSSACSRHACPRLRRRASGLVARVAIGATLGGLDPAPQAAQPPLDGEARATDLGHRAAPRRARTRRRGRATPPPRPPSPRAGRRGAAPGCGPPRSRRPRRRPRRVASRASRAPPPARRRRGR